MKDSVRNKMVALSARDANANNTLAGASNVGGHPHRNLGKYLHPSKGKPASEINHTVDANASGKKVRVGF